MTLMVTPKTATLPAGETIQLTAQLLDDHGQPLPGQSFVWSAQEPTVARVDARGVVSAVAPGNASIVAEVQSGQLTGTASIVVTNGSGGGGGGGGGGGSTLVVPGSHAGAGAFEPAGMTPIGYARFDTLGTFNKIDIYNRASYTHPSGAAIFLGNGGAYGQILTDPSKGKVLDLLMPQGCMGSSGTSCGNFIGMIFGGAPVKEVYVALDMYVDNNYWLNVNGNKIFGPQFETSHQLFWVRHYPLSAADEGSSGRDPYMEIGSGPSICGLDRNVSGNGNVLFSRGQWHRIELYTKTSSGSCTPDGIIRVWVDGRPSVDISDYKSYDATTPAGGLSFLGVKIQNILGGKCTNGRVCPDKDMHIRYSQAYISGR